MISALNPQCKQKYLTLTESRKKEHENANRLYYKSCILEDNQTHGFFGRTKLFVSDNLVLVIHSCNYQSSRVKISWFLC